MLKLHKYNETNFDGGCIAYLDKAVEVKHEKIINDLESIYFEYPCTDEKAALIKENMIVSHEGKGYVILKVIRTTDGKDMLSISASDLFSTYGRAKHIQNIPDMIGVKPSVIFKTIIEDTRFTAFTEAELNKRGMTWLDSDGYDGNTYLIDFFSTDKTNVWDATKTLIDNCGKGEIYRENFKAAVVKRIGKDNGVRLTLEKNMDGLTITKDMESVITRLYPYGSDDMHIGSVNGGVQYIDSGNIDIYGIREGYKDYSDYTDPAKIKAHAEWEFDADNEDRIDVPKVTITGGYIDLDKLPDFGDGEKIDIGDTVHIYDNDRNVYHQRVVSLTRYPFEPKQPTIEIGHIETNAFSVMWNLMQQSKKYKKSQTTNSSIASRSLSGVVNTYRNNVQSDNGMLKIVNDLLTISDGSNIRIRMGNYGGEFVFIIYDKEKNEAVYLNEDGKAVYAGTIETMQDCIIQGALRVGKAGNNTKGIEFYGDTYQKNEQSECYGKLLPGMDANDDKIKGIALIGNMWVSKNLYVGGKQVLTEDDLSTIKTRLERVENMLDSMS